MGRPNKKRRFPQRSSNGEFQRRQPAVDAPSGDAPDPLEESALSPMEVDDDAPHDDHDEDWRDEDAGAASGGGQATLSFMSAAACVSAAAVRSAQSLCPEIAPLPRAVQRQPSRTTVHRRRQASLEAAKTSMRSLMAGWLGTGAEQQSQQSAPQSLEAQNAVEQPLGEQASDPIPAAACAEEPRGGGESDGDSDSCSETDMLVEDGEGLELQYWVGEGEQEEKQGDVGELCDGYSSCGSGGFLDGADYPDEWSDGSLDSGGERDAERDGEVEARRTSGAAAMGAGYEDSGAGGAGANRECCSSGATSAAAKEPVRRSSRETSSVKYAPPRRASAQRLERGGPGRGNRVMTPDEVGNDLARCSGRAHKRQRVLWRAHVKLVGALWTKEKRARHTQRTRRNCSERQKQVIDTFREGKDKIDKVCLSVCRCVLDSVCVCACVFSAAWVPRPGTVCFSFRSLLRAAVGYMDELQICTCFSQRLTTRYITHQTILHAAVQAGNNLSSLVENAEKMLTPERVSRVCRVISVVRAYFALE